MNLVREPAPKRRLDLKGRVEMTHGGGGRAMVRLIEEIFLHHFDDPLLQAGGDQAMLGVLPGRLVMSTDSHVVSPLFFRGGDIGALSVHGTVNDVAMAGAVPLYLSAAFILEEGFPLADLDRIAASMAAAARGAGVRIVTGDTKVVERGKADGVFITTTGVGSVPEGVEPRPARIAAGDRILINGSIGDHGMAILSQRENMEFESEIVSDSAPLGDLVRAMVNAVPDLHCLRDPTRGGVAATLNELALASGCVLRLDERAIPLKPDVAAACELVGLDPLYVANEGKLLAFCAPQAADRLLAAMRAHPRGAEAAIIGTVVSAEGPLVEMDTAFGGRRTVDWLNGEQLPRIC
jgi:hydrogenase expression/formation protein HypE